MKKLPYTITEKTSFTDTSGRYIRPVITMGTDGNWTMTLEVLSGEDIKPIMAPKRKWWKFWK